MERRSFIFKLIPIVTVTIMMLFLSGYLYPIERGTHRGGVTGAIGVAIILFIMFSVIFLAGLYYRKKRS